MGFRMWKTRRCGLQSRYRNGIPVCGEPHVNQYPIEFEADIWNTYVSPTAAVVVFGLNARAPNFPTSMRCFVELALAPAANTSAVINVRYMAMCLKRRPIEWIREQNNYNLKWQLTIDRNYKIAHSSTQPIYAASRLPSSGTTRSLFLSPVRR
jgi:hypothetical protein